MIVPLGVWVLGEAAGRRRTGAIGSRAPRGSSMSVNLSTRQLFEQDLIARVAEIAGGDVDSSPRPWSSRSPRGA